MELNTAKIIKRLKSEGWVLLRHGANHDVYARPDSPLTIQVPRTAVCRLLSSGLLTGQRDGNSPCMPKEPYHEPLHCID